MGTRDAGKAPHSTGQKEASWRANWSAVRQWHRAKADEAAASESTGWAAAPH